MTLELHASILRMLPASFTRIVSSDVDASAQNRSPIFAAAAGVCALFLLGSSIASHAQSVSFAGVQTTVAATGLRSPWGVAVDAAGDVFIADTGNSRVVEVPAGGGAAIVVGSGLSSPAGVAVDGAGDIFIADYGNNRVVEVAAGGGGQTTLAASGLNHPIGVAVDGAGDVFIADSGNNRVVEVAAGGSGQTTVGATGLNGPTGVAVDGAGNVFIADYGNGQVVEVPAGGGAQTTVGASGLNEPFGVAVDGAGDIFIGDPWNSRVVEVPAGGGTQVAVGSGLTNPYAMAVDGAGDVFIADTNNSRVVEVERIAVNFGSANVCPSGQTTPAPCSQNVTLNYSVNNSVTLGSTVTVLTQGAPNLDFTLNAATCTGTVSAGNLCTVTVSFAPLAPGARLGAVQLTDNSGNLLASTMIYGQGQGPAIAFGPAVQTTVPASGLTNPYCVALDGADNVFIADPGNNRVVEVPSGGGPQTTVGSGLNTPFGLAVDGAGDVFIADAGNNQVVEVPSGGGAQTTVGSGLSSPYGVAVDGAGDVFIADSGNNRVIEVPAGGGPQTTVGSGLYPYAVAVDGAGDVFVADRASGNNRVVEVPAGGGPQITIVGGLFNPSGVAVDSAGDVFVADFDDNRVVEVPAGGGTPTVVGSGLYDPFDMAADGAGNLFIVDWGNSRVVEVQRAQPPALTFASTAIGSTSSDSPQGITIQDIGNQPLNAVSPGLVVGGPSFLQVAGTGTPADCTGSFALAPGASCNLSISFEPQSTGALASTAVFTDNALNASLSAMQSVALQGTGLPQSQTISFAQLAPASASYGSAFTVAAESTSGLTVVLSVDAGSSGVCSLGTPTVLSGVTSATVTMLNGAGTCTIDASQGGNSTYSAAAQQQTSAVALALGQAISFTEAAPASASYSGTFTVAAESTSGLTVTLSVDSSSTSVCSLGTPGVASGVTSAAVTILSGSGTCTIDATQSGNSDYSAATPQQTSTQAALANQAPLTITGPASVTYGTTGTATATGGSGTGVVSFSAGASTGCSLSGSTVSVINVAGTCLLTASKAADNNYNAATSNAQIQFAYVANGGSNNVSAYSIDTSSGALAPVAGSPFGAGNGPNAVAVNASGTFAYAANQYYPRPSGTVSAYTIDASSGALAPMAGSPFADADGEPYGLAVDPAGKFAYVTNVFSDSVSAYTIDAATGALTEVAGSPFGTGHNPEGVAVDPTGKFVYVPSSFSNDISAYTIDATTGALTPVAGSPFGTGATPQGVANVAFDPAGKFVYVTNTNSNAVSAYTINASSGALAPVAGSPFGTGTNPSAVAVSPAGNFAYVTNSGSNNVSVYTIDPTSGALSTVAGSPFGAGSNPSAVKVDATGSFVYVTNSGSNNVSVYAIDLASGALRSVTGSPFGADSSPYGIAVAEIAAFPVSLVPASQTIVFSVNAPASAEYGSQFTVAATGGGSGNAVVYTSAGGCTNAGATYTMTAASGNCTVLADQAGNANYAAAAEVTETTVAVSANGGVSVASSLNPSVYGEAVTFTATITSDTGLLKRRGNRGGKAMDVTGTVTWSGNTGCGTTGVTAGNPGTATCTTSTLAVGAADAITANYSGDANHNAGTGTVSQEVDASGGNVSVASSLNPSVYGEAVTFTATITSDTGLLKRRGNRGGKAMDVTGTVTWSGNTGCGTTGVTAGNPGMATCTTSALGGGSETVTAAYSGDANHNSGTGSVSQTVNQASQTIVFSVNAPASAEYGSQFTVAATGGGSGNAVVYTSAGGCTNAGATYTMTAASGNCTVLADQAGNANYAAAAEVTETTVAVSANGGVSVASSLNPSVYGEAVTFTATITSDTGLLKRRGNRGGKAMDVTGTVTWSGNTGCGTTGVTAGNPGTATCTTSALGGGSETVTAAYSGDANHNSGTGSVSQTVNQASQTIVFSVNAPASAEYGSQFTVAATGGGSGNAVVYTSAGGCTNAGATYTMTAASGNCTVLADQAGNANYAAAAEVTETTVAVSANGGVSVASSLNPSVYGEAVTFTATITSDTGLLKRRGNRGGKAMDVTGTVTWSGNTGCGTTGVTAGNPGTATCTTSTLAVGAADAITANYSGDANHNAGTGTVSQEVDASGGNVSVASSLNPSVYGEAVTFTATITSDTGLLKRRGNRGGKAMDVTGTVTWSGNTGCGTTGVTAGNPGTATCTTSTLAVGAADAITANYSGDANHNAGTGTVSQEVDASGGNVSVASSLNPSVYGEAVTFTATISGDYGLRKGRNGARPMDVTGTVTWSGNTGCGTTGVTAGNPGMATCTTSALAVGAADAITANYSGDANHNAGTGTVSQEVDASGGNVSVASSLNPSVYGEAVTFTATISGDYGLRKGRNGARPMDVTGTVTWSGNTGCGTTGVTAGNPGTATCTTSTLAVGAADAITANYSGDANHNAGTGTVSQEVDASNGNVSVASSLNPSVYGEAVTFTATITSDTGLLKRRGNRGGKAMDVTGTVTWSGNTGCGTTGVTAGNPGTATCTTSTLAVGAADAITANYSGDANHNAGTGTVSQEVDASGGNVSVASSLNPSVYGEAVTFTATITSDTGLLKRRGNRGGKAMDVTGTVTWSGNTGCGTTGVTAGNPGTATCTTSVLPGGTDAITATYSGDTNHNSGSGTLSGGEVVSQAGQTITFGALSNQSYGAVPFTVRATASSGLAVSFNSQTTSVCTVSGTAVTLVAVGMCTIQATQAGDANYAAATPVNQSFQVNAADFTLTSNPTSATIAAGQPAMFTLTTTPEGSFTSPISFSCSGLPAEANCKFSPATLTPDTSTMTTKLTIGTAARTSALTPPRSGGRSIPFYTMWIALPAMLLGTGIASPKRRKLLSCFLVFLVVGGCLLQAACGSGGTSASGGGTPAGTYTISITGAASSTQHTTTVTLTVQ